MHLNYSPSIPIKDQPNLVQVAHRLTHLRVHCGVAVAVAVAGIHTSSSEFPHRTLRSIPLNHSALVVLARHDAVFTNPLTILTEWMYIGITEFQSLLCRICHQSHTVKSNYRTVNTQCNHPQNDFRQHWNQVSNAS